MLKKLCCNVCCSLSEALSKKITAENLVDELNNKIADSESERYSKDVRVFCFNPDLVFFGVIYRHLVLSHAFKNRKVVFRKSQVSSSQSSCFMLEHVKGLSNVIAYLRLLRLVIG